MSDHDEQQPPPVRFIGNVALRVERCACCNATMLVFTEKTTGQAVGFYEMSRGESVDNLIRQLTAHRNQMASGAQRGADLEKHRAWVEAQRERTRGRLN